MFNNYCSIDDLFGLRTELKASEQKDPGFFEALGPNNTVADFVSELYDSLFRDILGNDVMDSKLGSFSKDEMFRIMSKVFLQDGNQKLYKEMVEKA